MSAHGARRTVHGLLMVTAAMAIAGPAAAQQQEDDGRPAIASVSRIGKWPALAGAIGFTAVALVRNRDADRVYDGLARLCFAAPDGCRLVAGFGDAPRYASADAEALYQETLRIDRSARNWLLLGQVALAASGAMFLIDLITGDDLPPNIPFDGMSVMADGRRLGFRVAF